LLLDRLVRAGNLDLTTMVARLTTDPAKLFGLPGGSLAVGRPGDVTILDLGRELRIEPQRFNSRSRNTPFGGWQLVGGPIMTVVNGHVVASAQGF